MVGENAQGAVLTQHCSASFPAHTAPPPSLIRLLLAAQCALFVLLFAPRSPTQRGAAVRTAGSGRGCPPPSPSRSSWTPIAQTTSTASTSSQPYLCHHFLTTKVHECKLYLVLRDNLCSFGAYEMRPTCRKTKKKLRMEMGHVALPPFHEDTKTSTHLL